MKHTIKHLFVINPRSFWNKSKQNYLVAKIHEFFREIEDSSYEIHVSRFPRDAVGFIPLFARDLPDETILRVYAVGGDGILFDCLNGVMGLKHIELAAIPFGHTNNFLRGFDKNPKVLFRNIYRQYNAPTIPMDVIRCGNNYALNYCVVGIEAEAIRHAEHIRRRLEKGNAITRWLYHQLYTLFYFVGGVAAAYDKRLVSRKYEIDIDEQRATDTCQSLSIFNGPYYGGNLHPVSGAMPNDGMADILIFRARGILQTFCLYPFLVSDHYRLLSRYFSLRQGRNIKIRSDTVVPISLDGIVFFEPEIEAELLPAAIQFVDASQYGYRGGRQ